MELRLAGYFPKHIATRPDWLDAPSVVDIYSVSGCVSEAPDGWIDEWLHNDLGLFDTPDLALQVVPAAAPPAKIFAYRLSVVRFANGEPEEWAWPPIAPMAVPETFRRCGFRKF